MHIVYIANSIIPSTAANAVNVMRMCSAFAKNGHKVSLIVPMRAAQEVARDAVDEFYGIKERIDMMWRPWRGFRGRSIAYAADAAWTARKLMPDLVYSRFLLGAAAACVLRLPVVYEAHVPPSQSGRMGSWLVRWILRRAALLRIVVISTALKDEFERVLPESARKLVVAHDGADPIVTSNRVQIAREGERLKVGYIGQLYRGKGMELIAKLAPLCPWADFHIVGGNPDSVQQWREATKDSSNILFHGFVPPAEVHRYCSEMDVLIAPYQRQVGVYGDSGDVARWMSPLKLFEYMSARRAIVCSDLPVLREILQDGHNSLLCAPEAMEEWRTALSKLREDSSLARRLADAAYEEFSQRFTWVARARHVLQGLRGPVE